MGFPTAAIPAIFSLKSLYLAEPSEFLESLHKTILACAL